MTVLLSPEDQAVLRQAQDMALVSGSGSYEVDLILGRAADSKSVLAAFDYTVWEDLQDLAHVRGVEDENLQYALGYLSGSQAQLAAKAALDDIAWQQLLNEVSYSGFFSAHTNDKLNALSGGYNSPIRRAVSAGLDQTIWRHAHGYIRQSRSLNSIALLMVLNKASSETSEQIMTELLRRHYAGQYSDRRSSSGQGAHSGSQQQQGSTRNTKPPKAERQAKQPMISEAKRQEILEVIDVLITRQPADKQDEMARSVAWLTRDDRALLDTLRVMNSVRAIRASVAEKGETVTDKEIYKKYRLKIEDGSADKNSEEYKRLELSCKILLALMGGRLNKLPF